MIPSKSSVVSSLATSAVLAVGTFWQAFVVGAFVAPMPFFFFGLIMDPYPSKVAIISSIIVILSNYFGFSWLVGVILAVTVGTGVDVWRKAKTKT